MKTFNIICLFFLILHPLAADYNWDTVKTIMDNYLNNGAFPGAVLRVANNTHTLFTHEVGHLSKDSRVPFSQ
jgi:hypothetical protein